MQWVKYLEERILYDQSLGKMLLILPNFLVCKFCGKAQFPHSFGQITRIYVEINFCAFPQNFDTGKLGEIIVFLRSECFPVSGTKHASQAHAEPRKTSKMESFTNYVTAESRKILLQRSPS